MWKYQEQKAHACSFLHLSQINLGWMRKFPYFIRLKYTKAWLFRDITFPYTYPRKDNKFSFPLLLSTFINIPHTAPSSTLCEMSVSQTFIIIIRYKNSLLYGSIYFFGITASLSWNQCYVCCMWKSILTKNSELEIF